MGTPASAIRFDTYGSLQEETFVEQEVYRTITAGVSPYLSKVRGISLESVKGGGDYQGEYMAPQDKNIDGGYESQNIGPFLEGLQNASGPKEMAIQQSASSNSSLKTALDKGNVTLAEELAMLIEGSHPTQPTPTAPSAGELQLDFMGQDIANNSPGIGKPTALSNVTNLSHGKRTANPADLIANSPSHRALIAAFTDIVQKSFGEKGPSKEWKETLHDVKFMDITESSKKKWIANQIKGGYRKNYRNADGTMKEQYIAGLIQNWSAKFEGTMDEINGYLADIAKGFKALKASGDYSEKEQQKILNDLDKAYGAGGGHGSGGTGTEQSGPFVANHMLNVWNLAFREYIAGGYDSMPAFMEQQPINDTGWWFAFTGRPVITPNGNIGFDWNVQFIDSGQAGVATDGVIIAEYAATTIHKNTYTQQEYYDLARAQALDWFVQTQGRVGAHEEWIYGMVNHISQPELNIELMPDATAKGFVGPITQIAGADMAKSFYEQIMIQAKDPSYTGPYADLFAKMLEVSNKATAAWKMSAGVQGGELFGEMLNDYSSGGIWPDDDKTWTGNEGKDLGVSPFLVGTKEYVKLFGSADKVYNVTINPAKLKEVRAGTEAKGLKPEKAGFTTIIKGQGTSMKRPVHRLGKRGKGGYGKRGLKSDFSRKYNDWLRSQG